MSGLAIKSDLVYLQGKERPFAFEGVYDKWHDPKSGIVTTSFTIINTKSNRLLQSIGVKRMLVILPIGYEKVRIKSTKHLSWVLRMLNQFASDKMNVCPVNDLVNIQGENNASMINPKGDRLQIENSPLVQPVPIIIGIR